MNLIGAWPTFFDLVAGIDSEIRKLIGRAVQAPENRLK